jgi:hypothetical protein
MALEKSFEKFGSTFADAYHNISDLRYRVSEYEVTQLVEQEPDEDGNPVMPVATTVWETNRTAHFTVKTYVDSAARTGHKEAISQSEHSFTPDWEATENVLAQAYTYLKTLDAFDGATDA